MRWEGASLTTSIRVTGELTHGRAQWNGLGAHGPNFRDSELTQSGSGCLGLP